MSPPGRLPYPMSPRAAPADVAAGAAQMTDRELRDQLMTLLVAGHDTTATGLSWALERLTRNPAILARAVRAARDGDDDYLDAVVKETLRIRPVVFDVGRVLKEPVELAGHLLPAGVMVIPGMVLVHASDAVYPQADRFDPDRMVGATLSPSTYLPFGGGNRRCLGATFATVEFRVVLAEILRRVELATTDKPRRSAGASSTSSSCRTAAPRFVSGPDRRLLRAPHTRLRPALSAARRRSGGLRENGVLTTAEKQVGVVWGLGEFARTVDSDKF